ncbi:MAG: 5-formyltetrahydrofolate cyclo-ligase [Leptospirillia bacterium]
MCADLNKDTLRRRIRNWRDGLTAPERTALSEEVEARIATLPEFLRAETVLTYAHFGSEVQTSGLRARTMLLGKRLVLPRVEGDGLALYRITNPLHDMQPGVWDIPEPVDGLTPVSPEEVGILLLPGVAFDPSGGRLGYGRGYFDRVLAKTSGLKVGLGFDGQVVDQVPTEAHDVAMDLVVTPTRIIRCDTGQEVF